MKNRSCVIVRIPVFMIVLLSFAVLVFPQTSWAEEFFHPADPAKCSTDPKGMAYIAVGHRVFLQPIKDMGNNIFVRLPIPTEKKLLPVPPKPTDPEGCPDHPLQAMQYAINNFFSLPNDPAASLSKYPIKVGIINNPGEGVSNDGLYKHICTSFDLRDTSQANFIGCQTSVPCTNTNAYAAENYTYPDGTSYKVICDTFGNRWVNGQCDNRPLHCRVSYKLYDDLNIMYGFSLADMPVSESINYDRELRHRIEMTEVKNYPWPQNNPTSTSQGDKK